VLVPDPAWPPAAGNILAAQGVPVACPLYEAKGWRYDLDELESKITPKTRVLYLNSPNNPTGGMLTRADIVRIAAIAQARNLWVISDEAYEDVVFDGEHISIASLPGMYDRTIPLYTFSKSYAMTGLRLGYLAVADESLRDRLRKLLFFTTSNVSSVVQYGGIGGLEAAEDVVERYRVELEARRNLFYAGVDALGGVFVGEPPRGAFYAFLKFDSEWRGRATQAPSAGHASPSWAITEYLISAGRIGCVPGIDFGPGGEGYVRFCFARDRAELRGALESMRELFT
jgi:aspartate aminotransferase